MSPRYRQNKTEHSSPTLVFHAGNPMDERSGRSPSSLNDPIDLIKALSPFHLGCED